MVLFHHPTNFQKLSIFKNSSINSAFKFIYSVLPELVDAGDLLRLEGPGLLIVLLRGVVAILV